MKIQLIRHATLLLYIGGKKILVDPMLSPAGTMSPIPDVENKNSNPLVDLPVSLDQIIDINAVIITHTHPDHFDDAAAKLLPKQLPIFCQLEDAEKIRELGFSNTYPIDKSFTWNDITLHRIGGQHGTGAIGRKMGVVSGFIIKTKEEPPLYIIGDSIWCSEVEEALDTFKPELTISFAGAARFNIGEPITMTSKDIYNICKKSPDTKVIAVHMEAWNHCSLSRKELNDFIQKENLSDQVYLPYDGECLSF